MKRVLCLVYLFTMISCSTPSVPQKFSEEVSRNIYATKDSIDLARFDLASEYADISTRLVTPPSERIKITSIHKPSAVLIDNKNKGALPTGENYIVVPQKFKGLNVLVVGSEEYNQLLKIKEYAEQVKSELDTVTEQKNEADKQLIKLEETRQKLQESVTILNVKLQETKSALLKRNLLLGGLVIGFCVYIALKIRKSVSII
jgi:hypothetical protein